MPEDGAELAVVPDTTRLFQCGIVIEDFGGDYAVVGYRALPDDQPKTYGNTVNVWRASTVPWQVSPWRRKRISENLEHGREIFTGIVVQRTTHIFGYAVGPDPLTVCASARLDLYGNVAGQDSVSIAVQRLTRDSVTVRYHVLSGYRPATVGNWIGLWKGSITPYWCPEPLGVALPPDVTDDLVVISDVPLTPESTYTLAYFMTDADRRQDNTTAAALLTFDTQPADKG